MDTLDMSIEKLLDSKPVYSEPMPQMAEGFMQKMGQKFLTEEDIQRKQALNEFGFNQNSLNIDFIRAFLELQRYCRELQKQIEDTEADYRKAFSGIAVLKKELDNVRLRTTLNSNQIEKMDGSLYKYTDKLESYALSIRPGARTDSFPKGCREIDISETIGYFDKIERAKETEDTAELEKFCGTAITKSLSVRTPYDEMVIDFYGNTKIAAVLYANLNKNSIYRVKKLSERETPAGRFSVICGEYLFVPRKLMLSSAVIVVTGEYPLEESNEEELKNLKFLNDCGLHTYITLTEEGRNALIEKGFRNVTYLKAKKLADGEIVKIAERAFESAVPSGAVSLNTLKEVFENFNDYYLTLPEDIDEYVEERKIVYPYDCLTVMEKAAVNAIRLDYFTAENVNSCRLIKTQEGRFNFIDGLNYINHLTCRQRRNLYQKIAEMLEPGGLFVMNAFDAVVGIKVRSVRGWNYLPNYESLWTRDQLIQELRQNGFKIKYLLPTGAGVFDFIPQKYRKHPAEWIVGVTL